MSHVWPKYLGVRVNIKSVFVCTCALLGTVSTNSLTSEEVSLREMSTYAGNFGKI